MQVTARFWEVLGLGGVFVALAVILGEPIFLIGAGLLSGLLLVRQYVFIEQVADAVDTLHVTQSVSREHVHINEPFVVTLQATAVKPLPVEVEVRADPPLSGAHIDTTESTLWLTEEETADTAAFQTALLTVGVGSFDEPIVTFQSRDGFFETTISMGSPVSVTGEPRTPQNIHIGQGGEQIASGFGDHVSEHRGPGLEPAEVRQYVYGDDISHIDWNATARLNQPHIRESNVSTAYQTALIVDHRSRTADGTPGRQKLDYLREIAIALLDSASTFGDPVSLLTVGEEGATNTIAPRSSKNHYRLLRMTIHDLQPTTNVTLQKDSERRHPVTSRHIASEVVTDKTTYSETLKPYFRAATHYVDQFADKPLLSTVTQHLSHVQGTVWTIVLTDDTNRGELYETVKANKRADRQMAIFLTPSVLFQTEPSAGFESMYQEYDDFEQFRKQLDRMEGVSAFEVGHQDRLKAIREKRPNATNEQRRLSSQ